ncbi:GGDEF domain-containing protein [Faecalispora anaeroviscerum]|uniref:GGDEF domain-containing protein n=1 Tax=Faecalispora anaeroviscerum TaxID=2991836 RepID=UPI0024BA24BA|nr:sensor domain-containing diguanylate cyclase [Faecalispora anaeroviscerum]
MGSEIRELKNSSSEMFQNWNQSIVMVRRLAGEKRLRSCVLQISDRCLALFGYTRKEFEEKFQQDYNRLVHPEDRQAFHSSVEKQTAATGFFYAKYRVFTKDNREIYCMEYGVQNEDGSLVCTLMEVTNEVTQCNQAKKAKARLEALIRGVAGGVLIAGFNQKKFTYIDASDGYFRIFGYTREQYQQLERSSTGICSVYAGNHQKMFREILEWLSKGAGRPLTSEYKIQRKDGSSAWITAQISVIEKTQNGWEIQMLISDNTMYRKIMHELQHDQRNITQQSISDDILFDYDVITDTLHLSDNVKLIGVPAVINQYSEKALQKKSVYPADIPVFQHFIKNLRNNIKVSNTILRFQHKDGRYYWYHLIGATITDDSGRITKMVGKAVNMNRQKEEMLELVERAQRDPFTKLYNKTMTETLVRQSLSYESDRSHAILVIDIDNFKEINDTYGHLHGDAVLVEFSRILKLNFEDKGVVGRIGGDEFLVFLRGEKSLDTIRQKAQEVCQMFQQAESLSNMQHLLSASVGVSLFPQDGTAYEELFHKADQALYVAKRHGKGDMVFYSDITQLKRDSGTSEPASLVTEIRRDITPDYRVDPHLVFEATEELLSSGGSPDGMGPVLRMIGRVLSVGRVYLAECSEDHLQCTIACEWCAPNVEPVFGRSQKVAFDELRLHYQRFDEWGLFRCYDVQEAEDTYFLKQSPSTRSTLHCVLYDQRGSIRGFVGCDDVTTNRTWNQTESMSLTVLAGLISRFAYYYKEAKEHPKKTRSRSSKTKEE